ncbi:hypothetical protein ABEB36_002437 [Hypothenemus hampei]|uniref:Claspin n=1 Tax=Hypothenemus hampei TaxID=57062 RepID=A0ABD1F656_HYPHA
MESNTTVSQSNLENQNSNGSPESPQQDFKELEYSLTTSLKNKSKLILDDSDSDNEVDNNVQDINSPNIQNNKRHKRIAVLDSDSDSNDSPVTPHNKSFTDECSTKDDESAMVDTTYSTSDIVSETNLNLQKSRLALLCDSDSDHEDDHDQEILTDQQSKSNSKTKETREVPKTVMTAKDAAELRKEIQSESQRMLRERNISLPYHKPKSRSLKEFLTKRPKLGSIVTSMETVPPSVAIKMSIEQLELISKKQMEREEKLKEFYKSESESDNEENDQESVSLENNEISSKETEECKNSTVLLDDKCNETNTLSSEECANPEGPLHKDIQQSEILEKTNLSQQENNSEPDLELNEEMTESTIHLDPKPQRTSEQYDFTLEDEQNDRLNDDVTNKIRKFTDSELDKEIENYDEPQKEEKQLLKSALDLLKEKLVNEHVPKLCGSPDDVIDLDTGVTNTKEVVELMERFSKHVASKKHHSQHKVKLSIVTVESGGDIHKEEVAMNVDSDDELMVIEEKPGAKLQKLKEDLQKQMEQRKSEIWQQRAKKNIEDETKANEEKEGFEADILDDEDEEEYLTEEEITDEEELEEDDVSLKDKKEKKSMFLDEEAEEDDCDDLVEDEEQQLENINTHSKNIDDSEDSQLTTDPETVEEQLFEKKKIRKRILKPADDSDEEEEKLDSSVTNTYLDSTLTADEDEIPSHQPPQFQTPIRPIASQSKSINDFLTPISFITSIQNLTSASKLHKDATKTSPIEMPSESHILDQEDTEMQHKDPLSGVDLLQSQGSMQNFDIQESSSAAETLNENNTQEIEHEEIPTTQDLLGICSGQFTGITQVESIDDVSSKQMNTLGSTQCTEFKSLDGDDMVISQLLDEEELENFKKKFESPIANVSQSEKLEAKEIIGGEVIDSDDENNVQQHKCKKTKKKNQKRIQFSDDESSEDNNDDKEEEEIDLHDDDPNIDNIGYDSEENEIDMNNQRLPNCLDGKKMRMTDFLEVEAELSESEWGSADEDEKDLDEMEFEAGDTETFDDEKVRTDIEKIHMRRMLDDDTREVKLLQELLLEDGEMHGTGRQRQFKWKNIDINNDQTEEINNEDDVYLDEEESEEHWRKMRHEREMFLKQHQEKTEMEDQGVEFSNTSQLLKIGQKILARSISNSNSQKNTPDDKSKSEDLSPFKNTFFSLKNKRGSFLNRNDQVLQRVAEYTKVSEEITDGCRKTTKHFLFQNASMSETIQNSEINKKRKAIDGTPNVLKKLRLNTNLSPAVKTFKKSERVKKLFSN